MSDQSINLEALFEFVTDSDIAGESTSEASIKLDIAGPAPDNPNSDSNAEITLVTSSRVVTKTFSISDTGKIQKQTAGNLSDGKLTVVNVGTLEEFGDHLHTLNQHQCFIYGVPPPGSERIVTRDQWKKSGYPASASPRTKTAFSWPTGGGILMLDYDAPKDGTAALTRDELFELLHRTIPKLADVDALWMPSTSSEIYNNGTGEQVTGTTGQRIYYMLRDAVDIPRTGKALLTHLWAHGHGRFEVSSSGSLLERGIFDSSVWQTNRIDFAGGASCTSPLEQRRGAPQLIAGSYRALDSQLIVVDPTKDVVEAAEKNKTAARAINVSDSAQKRAAWVEDHVKAMSAENSTASPSAISSVVKRAIEQRQLIGDWRIVVLDASGTESFVTVEEILGNPNKFHHMLTLDPLEPEYDGRRSVGKLFLNDRPYLYSFAHGGVHYALSKNLIRIENVLGREHDAVNRLVEVMRDCPDIFDFGPAIVTVTDGKTNSLNDSALRHWIGGVVQFWHTKYANNQLVEVLDNPSQLLCKTVIALSGSRKLKALRSVITAPTLRKDGSVLDSIGYDADSGLLLDMVEDEIPYIPPHPTEKQAKKALETLWFPFKDFPFVDELSRAAHLAALLTAVATHDEFIIVATHPASNKPLPMLDIDIRISDISSADKIDELLGRFISDERKRADDQKKTISQKQAKDL